MATYTVTKVQKRPNTEIDWPYQVYGSGYDTLSENSKVTRPDSTMTDSGLTLTQQFVWASKADYINNLRDADDQDSTLNTKQNQYNTYMALNNIEGEVTEEDGTVKVFNKSNKTWEET